MDKEIRKGLFRHKFVYHFLRYAIGWFLCILRNFSYDYEKIHEKPVLILSNHNSDFDPLLMVIGMKKHFKFVASANIMSGPVGKVIKYLVGPIPREKGADADQTVRLIIENLNAGIDVAMFPEGNKSWDGTTNFISKRTAEIFKQCRCGMVTYRFDGDYLRSPRWADYARRGKVHGRIVNQYSYEQLKDLSIDAIYDIIVSDLKADAYAYQDEHHFRYTGKHLAEGIEHLTYLCPVCQRFDTIHSEGNAFSCDCGMKAVYDEYGYLQGEQIREWNNTVKWNTFQKNWLAEHKEELKKQTALPFSQDDGLRLFHIVDNERVLLKENVKARLYGDRFELSDDDGFAMAFDWKTISKIGMFRSRSLYFTYRNERYELQKSSGFSLLKYFSLWRILTDKELF